MQSVYTIIRDNGDGSQSVEWYRGSDFKRDELIEAADADKYNSYASGDGVQLYQLRFPDDFNLDEIEGVQWESRLPGIYDWE